jgi:predicted HTH domain antitoxin
LTVHFPDSVLVAAREDPAHFQRRVLIQTLGSLYAQGKLSSGLAVQVLGCDRWEFYRLLTEYGFSVLDYGEDEQAYEANTSRELASRLTQS